MDVQQRPSDIALARAGALLFQELQRLALQEAERVHTTHDAA